MTDNEQSPPSDSSLVEKEGRASRGFLNGGCLFSLGHLAFCIMLGLVWFVLATAHIDGPDTEPSIVENVAGYSLAVLLSPLLAFGGVVQIWPPMPLLVVLVVVNSLVCGFGVACVLQLLRWIRARKSTG